MKTEDSSVPAEARSPYRYHDHLIRFTAVGIELPQTDTVKIEMDGEWKDGKYGLQLQVDHWQEIVPPTLEGVRNYLASGLLKGIGEKTADAIIEKFGINALEILEHQPDRLLEIRGITKERLAEIKDAYAETSRMRVLMTLLAPFKVTPTTAQKIYQHFGPSCADIVRQSPFNLCQVPGFGFKRIDAIVQKSGGDLRDPKRVHGALFYALEDARTKDGHLYLEAEALLKAAMQLLKDKDDPPEKTGVKYLTLSSTGKRMGTTSGSPIHFVGAPCSRVVYVTEGCLKADVAHALMHRTFVATLGVNNTAKLDGLFAFLHRNGTEEIIEAEDMDKYSNEMVEKGASKIYALAARHGMRCRRLTWNPNYKGIDDWQLALRRKEQKMKEDPGMTFKEQYLNGLCGLEMLETCTEKWHTMEADSISLRDYLGLTEQEYDAYLQTAPGVSFRELLDSQRKTQRFRVYQLDLEHGETRAFAFGGIDALHKAGFQQPPAAEYTLVYDGELTCPVGQDERDILERIFARYNQAFPPDYHGRSIAPSDVLELYDESERRYFYCDMAGFPQVKFSPALAKKA